MKDIQPGQYQATIKHILPATYRNPFTLGLEDGYFVQFVVHRGGTVDVFSDVVSSKIYHSSTLARLFGPLLKDMGIPLASFHAAIETLLGQNVALSVRGGRRGILSFQFMPVDVGGKRERVSA